MIARHGCWGYKRPVVSTSAAVKDLSVTRAKNTTYEQLLQEAAERTFHHPAGQTKGRAGRRCVLEDGERTLLRCISLDRYDMRARVMLMQNLTRQNRGREREVPSLALEALEASAECVAREDLGTQQCGTDVRLELQAVELALQALGQNGALYDEGAVFCRKIITMRPHLQQDVTDMLLSMLNGSSREQTQGDNERTKEERPPQ